MTIEDEEILLEELRSKVNVIEDKNGIRLEVVKLKDNVIPLRLVQGMGETMKLKIQDLRHLPLRDDDILLCSYPKTGIVYDALKAA